MPLVTPAIAAQTEPNASIIGQVTDESGAVLPGVTVTASSPSLQVREQSTVTDERGEYRLSTLPLGIYEVTYVLQGFQRVEREGLRLTAGFTARIDVILKVGAITETVTVSGASPVVDVASTTSATQLTRETIELIPTNRDGIQAVLAQTPGVRSNLDLGGQMGSPVQFKAFGQSGHSGAPWATIEGVLTVSPKAGNQSGDYQDYSTMEEVQVRTMGNDAEVPVNGVLYTAIVKSGGNTFHGGGWWSYTDNHLNGHNIDDALAAQGIRSGNPILVNWDLSADLGGRIVRDKLWFYGSVRRRRRLNELLDTFKPDGSPGTTFLTQGFETAKLSYQVNRSSRLSGFLQRNNKLDDSGASRLRAWESRRHSQLNGMASKIDWQGTFGQSVVASLLIGYWDWESDLIAQSDNVSTVDIVTLRQTGAHISFVAPAIFGEDRYHARGALSWYKPAWFWGDHAFKTGFDFIPQRVSWNYLPRGVAQDYTLRFSNGTPFQIVTYNSPVHSSSRDNYTGVYFKDVWRVGRRLTLNLGVRYAHDDLFIPEQSRTAGTFAPAATFPRVNFNVWDTIVPRLHAAYDVTGQGKTVIKGGWGRFVAMRGIDDGEPGNRNVFTSTTYTWHDLNGNRAYDPGEVDLDPNGRDFISVASRGIEANWSVNPDEQPDKFDEFTLGIEQEILPNFAVRITGIYSRQTDVRRLLNTSRPYEAYSIPITNPVPGPDGNVANGPGTTITYYEYPEALRGLAFQTPMLVNDPTANKSWKSFEIAASKRLSNRWQLMASYSATKNNDPLVTNIGGGLDFAANTVDPNAEIFSANTTWEWLGRFSAAYQLPWDLLVSGNYEYRSGEPWARTALFRGGTTIPSIVLRVEPIGSQRFPSTNLLTFRLEKAIQLSGHRVAVILDAFNMLNINSVTRMTQQSGASFGRPTAIVPARSVSVGVSYTF